MMNREQSREAAGRAPHEQPLRFADLARLVEPVEFAAAGDPEGREWIARLPALTNSLCQRCGLELESGEMRHGYGSVVMPVHRLGELFVLKLTWPADRVIDEARALAVWDGHGAVRMYEADVDAGALLLERLDWDRTLSQVNGIEAAAVAGSLLRRLAIPAPAGFRDVRVVIRDSTRSWRALQKRLGGPVPEEWLEEAVRLSGHLAEHAGNRLLIHSDLHYDNILAGRREPWLAIDPRAMAGEPEQAVPELMWTRHDVQDDEGMRLLLATLIESGSLDAGRAREWLIVRCVDYWLWGLEHGLTKDPKRCRRILEALL